MKRELKVAVIGDRPGGEYGHKANPDEKGTESLYIRNQFHVIAKSQSQSR